MMGVKYFCLHHPDLADRRVSLESKFNKLGLDVEWVCGFPPHEITIPPGSTFKNIFEYSLYLKQQYCIEQQVKKEIPLIIVLEDDVILPENFVEFTDICFKEFENLKGDILSLGTCCKIVAKDIIPGRHVYYRPEYRTRCAHCYALTLHAAKIIYKYIATEQCAFDFKLNTIIEQEALRVCYAEPGILQATEEQLIKSSLQI